MQALHRSVSDSDWLVSKFQSTVGSGATAPCVDRSRHYIISFRKFIKYILCLESAVSGFSSLLDSEHMNYGNSTPSYYQSQFRNGHDFEDYDQQQQAPAQLQNLPAGFQQQQQQQQPQWQPHRRRQFQGRVQSLAQQATR